MNVRIRAALAADIDALLAIENAAFSTDRISRRSFRLLIESDTAAVLVAEREGGLAGYCVVLYRRGSGVARLYSIASAENAAGQGIGKRLLQAAEDAAYENDRLILRLEVREDNPRPITLYEKNGHRRIGQEPD